MRMNNIIKLIFCFIVVVFFVFVISPFLFNMIFSIISFSAGVTYETKNAWISYIGSSMGGIITLMGVILTLMYNEKIRKKSFDDNLKLTNEQLRLEKLPYLTFKIIQKDDFSDLKFKCWRNIDIGENGLEEVYIYIVINNNGINVAKNARVQIIVNDVVDQGQVELFQDIIQVNETRYSGLVFRCNRNYISMCENENVRIKMIFFYHDILGNCYIQKFDGSIQILHSENKEDLLSASFFSFEDPVLTEIHYYYISEEDISRKENEKQALIEANVILNKKNSFSRKEELDDILSKFNEVFSKSKMGRLIKLIRNKERNPGGGYEKIANFIVVSDFVVFLKMDGGLSFGNRGLTYSYNLKVELDKKVVTFSKFRVISKNKITIIQLIKIKSMFKNEKVMC